MTLDEEEELFLLLAIEGPKGNVIVVFGDNSKGMFYYISPEDTVENGYTPDIEIGTSIINSENKTLVENDTKLIAEVVKNVNSDSFIVTLRKGISEIGIESSKIINTEVKIIPEENKEISGNIENAKITEILDDKNILIKLNNGFSFQNGKSYLIQSNEYIYFGSVKFEYNESINDSNFVSEILEAKNGSFTIRMSKDILEEEIKLEDFEIIQNINGTIEKVNNPIIVNKIGKDIIISIDEVEEGDYDKNLFYKISYKNIQKLISETIIIKAKQTMYAEFKVDVGVLSSFKNISLMSTENITGAYKFKMSISDSEGKVGEIKTIMTNENFIKVFILNENDMVIGFGELDVRKSDNIKVSLLKPDIKLDVVVEIGNVSSFKNIKIEKIYNLENGYCFGTNIHDGEANIGEYLTVMTSEDELKVYIKDIKGVVLGEAFLNVSRTGKITINLLVLYEKALSII